MVLTTSTAIQAQRMKDSMKVVAAHLVMICVRLTFSIHAFIPYGSLTSVRFSTCLDLCLVYNLSQSHSATVLIGESSAHEQY